MSNEIGTPVTVDYTNWQGVRSLRRIIPKMMCWGSNKWHPENQWFIDATDADAPEKGPRYFALAGIHGWNVQASNVEPSDAVTMERG